MEADLAESEGKEATAKADFETLMSSKSSELAAAGKAIETKTARSGQAAVEVVQAKADLGSTEEAVADDIDFKANLAKNCATKQKEWDERQKLLSFRPPRRRARGRACRCARKCAAPGT